MKKCLLATVAILIAAGAAQAAEVGDACAGVRKEILTARAELKSLRARLADERQALRRKMADVEAGIAAAEREFEELEERETAVAEETEKVSRCAAQAERELRRAFEALRENRKELEAVVARTGPVGDTFKELDRLLLSDEWAGHEARAHRGLLDIYLHHVERVSRIRRTQDEVVLPDGTRRRGTLLLCGGLGGVFGADGETCGILTLPPGAQSYHVVSGGLTRAQRRATRDALSGGGPILAVPLDISGGLATAHLTQKRTPWEFLQAGGLVMIPLGIVAVLALVMILERAFVLTRVEANADRVLSVVMPHVERGDFDGAIAAVKAGDGPIRRVLLAGIEHGRQSGENLEEVLREAILSELPSLERFLGTLGVFAAIAPLLGLLGTVSGMIRTFQVISVYGTGDARLLSGGISEALVTTEVGLVIAVPILLAHVWLSRRVRTIVGHIDRAAMSLVGAVGRRAGEADV